LREQQVDLGKRALKPHSAADRRLRRQQISSSKGHHQRETDAFD
jgi:hypothetical protein